MKLINGKKIAAKMLRALKGEVAELALGQKLTLAVILVGKNPASQLYVAIKEKRAWELGINFRNYLLPAQSGQNKIIKLINKLNKDKKVTAILVQLPLPKHLRTDEIIAAIEPEKDADGIQPKNLNILKSGGRPAVMPATTGAIAAALLATKVKLSQQRMAIVGKSKIVGLPTYYYFKNKVKAMAIYDGSTNNLAGKTSRADIVIVAIVAAEFMGEKYFKKGAVVIDVGINRVRGKTVGDVDFHKVKDKVAWLTPVPGGIGPITVAILMQNVIKLFKKQRPS